LFSYGRYLIQIQGHTDTQIYGLVIALFSVSSLCCKPLIGRWCDLSGFRKVYATTISLAIAGSMCYALAGWQRSLAMVLIGRLLNGCGAANTSLLYAYVSRTVPSSKQTRLMMLTGLTFPVGMALGPALNLLTTTADFHIFGVHFDETNSPGLLLAAVLLLLLGCVLVFLEEPPPYSPVSGKTSHEASLWREVCREIRRPAVAVCFVVIFDFNMFLAASEAVVVPVSQSAPKLAFGPLQNSYVYAGVAVCLMMVAIGIMTCGKDVPDRVLVLIAALGYCGGCAAAMLVWDYNMELWQFLVGEAALVICIPFAFSPNRALFSKLVKHSRHQALLSSTLSVVASLGSIAGPVWMGFAAGTPTPTGPVAHIMFWGILGLASLLVALILLTWFSFAPSDPALDVAKSSEVDHVAGLGPGSSLEESLMGADGEQGGVARQHEKASYTRDSLE